MNRTVASSGQKRLIGLFFGSFNPIHIGHMAIANYVLEEAGLEEVWLLPSPMNPLKTSDELLPYDLRCRMIVETIDGDARFRLNTIEQKLPSPHYTILALQALSVLHQDCQFFLVIGADNWLNFDHWYAHSRILLGWPLIVYPRPSVEVEPSSLSNGSIYLAHAPLLEISSSIIRSAFLLGKDYRYWLPQPQNWSLLEALHRDNRSNTEV